jgi:hypothetical protein
MSLLEIVIGPLTINLDKYFPPFLEQLLMPPAQVPPSMMLDPHRKAMVPLTHTYTHEHLVRGGMTLNCRPVTPVLPAGPNVILKLKCG